MFKIRALAATAALLCGSQAMAGLIGDTVGARYVGAGDTGVINSVVGAGEEGNFFGNQFFDFGDSTSSYLFLTPSNGSRMRFAIRNGGAEQIVETDPPPTGQWTHVAVTLGAGAARGEHARGPHGGGEVDCDKGGGAEGKEGGGWDAYGRWDNIFKTEVLAATALMGVQQSLSYLVSYQLSADGVGPGASP